MSQLLDELRLALADNYRVDKEIGRGGMATVFVAEDLKHGRRVAIKVINPELSSSIDGDRFRREIQIAARLSHPHILPVHDSGQANGLHFYVMPFVEGESLRDKIDRESQLNVDDAMQIACEVADALTHAHENLVIHRDIKPENILLHGGHAVVADFGIARVIQDAGGEKLTATGMSVGTAQYMSPEQFSGETVDGRSDLYSLACVLYEMLVGEVPFTGPNTMAIMARHAMEIPSSIRIVRPAVPEEIDDAVMRALEKVPADRFSSVAQFKGALLGQATSTYGRRTRSHAMSHAAIRPAVPLWRRRSTIFAAAALVLLAGGGGFASRRYLLGRATAVAGGDVNARRLAVLYFTDRSDGKLRYLADGLTESLIDELSQVPSLEVVSRNGVRAFRGTDVRGDSIARALKVGSIVRGEVEPRSGGGVKVTVRLVDAAADVDVAHKSIDIDSAHVADLQSRVASDVAAFLRERLGEEVTLRAERRATKSAGAWTLVQRAQKERSDADSLLAAGRKDAALVRLATADSDLSTAAVADRGWPMPATLGARAALTRAQILWSTRDVAAGAAIDSGMARADRALALDARSADALEVKGQLLYLRGTMRATTDPRAFEHDITSAESTLTRSITINKDQAGAWATLSALYYKKPDLQEAIRAAAEAYRADAYLASARTILTRLFWANHDLEYFPEAWKYCEEGRRRFATDAFFTECRLWMYTTRYPTPAPDSAWAWLDRYDKLLPPTGAARSVAEAHGRILVAGALARASLTDSARHVLARARVPTALDPKRELAGDEAIVRVMLGDQDDAVSLLKQYLTANPDHRKGFATRVGWWWRDLQGNPKFKNLIAGAR